MEHLRIEDTLVAAKLVKSMAQFLTKKALNNSKTQRKNDAPVGPGEVNMGSPNTPEIFDSKRIPNISFQFYLARIQKYGTIDNSTMIITFVYIDRLCERTKLTLTSMNLYRIFLAALVLAIKYNQDDYLSNEFYAKIGGVPLREMNSLEMECMSMLDNSLYVNDEVFAKYTECLMNSKDTY